jgi:hypothetical protein
VVVAGAAGSASAPTPRIAHGMSRKEAKRIGAKLE